MTELGATSQPRPQDSSPIVAPSYELVQSNSYIVFFYAMGGLLLPHAGTIENLKKEYNGKTIIDIKAGHPDSTGYALWVERTTGDFIDEGSYFNDYVEVRDHNLLTHYNEGDLVRKKLHYETNGQGVLVDSPAEDPKQNQFIADAVRGFQQLSQERGATLDISIGRGTAARYISDGNSWVLENPNKQGQLDKPLAQLSQANPLLEE